MKYYIKIEDSELGPFSLEELESKNIYSDNLIRSDDSNEYYEAFNFPELHKYFITEEVEAKEHTKQLNDNADYNIATFKRELLYLFVASIIAFAATNLVLGDFRGISIIAVVMASIFGGGIIFIVVSIIPISIAIVKESLKKKISSNLIGWTWILWIFAVLVQIYL